MKLPWNVTPLNVPPPGSSAASDDAVALSGQLRGAIQRLYAAHLTDTGLVDYGAMASSDAFKEYVEAAQQLPSLPLPDALPTDTDRIAFFVNLYNALTQHGIVVRGAPPTSSLGRLRWTASVAYCVGEYRLSLYDIENGILRRNAKLSILPAPFGGRDARRSLCVESVDPRIHFVLNCAASSCPPILFLTTDNLDGSLELATRGFLSNADNLQCDGEVVRLSMIFSWYKADFSPDGSDYGLLSYVADAADQDSEDVAELRKMLKAMETGSKKLAKAKANIEWQPYNWTLNSV